ncbi:hypothetical protein PR202_gb21821 [Eleusine coracana subsp. coracana]|uniref:Peroxidase n=1 Tax=Eleusine coracana subsp. coracana TaxID=191504 RepID=A0AAV5FED4_ELECO|nr:hypothetical protein QOZ80_7BG0610300 [Eleusine coracana subsp. coracana]GJN33243.1 hypothetical protein PR202_gb21821 [Eleusine coracana subsp. coracana]
MAKKQVAALVVTLLAFLSPAACQNTDASTACLSRWRKVPNQGSQVCPAGTRSSPAPVLGPGGLSVGYYNRSDSYCPGAEEIVRKAVGQAVGSDPGVGAGLIRLFFHDCFVRGCDASVLLNTPDCERFGIPNLSLRGYEVIDAAKTALQQACPNKVSCADIIAFAARDATYFLTNSKTYFDVPAGRYDGRVSFANETLPNLPGPFSNLQDLKDSFASKGLSTSDMVTLSGAHSIGRAQCRFFLDRFAGRTDAFAENLRAQCGGNDGIMVPQDYVTPDFLDSQYYKNMDQNVLFISDAVLNSTETIGQVTDYANNNQGLWESKFAKAMVKMGYIGIKTSAEGEIRMECSKVN